MSEEITAIKHEGFSFFIEDKVIQYFRVKTFLRERLFFKMKLPFENQASDFYIILYETFLLIKNNIGNRLKKDIEDWYAKEVPVNDRLKRQFFKKGLDLSEEFDKELEKLGVTSLNTFGGYIPL